MTSDLLSRGSQPHLLFDNMWTGASPEPWECLWILDSRALDDEKLRIVDKWQENGLPVGIY